jgi:hypothetical protein
MPYVVLFYDQGGSSDSDGDSEDEELPNQTIGPVPQIPSSPLAVHDGNTYLRKPVDDKAILKPMHVKLTHLL